VKASATMPRLRILQVTLDLSLASTGVYTTARNFYRILTGQGHDVCSLSFDRREYQSADRGFEIRSIPSSRLPALKRFAFSWRAASGGYDRLVAGRDALFLHSLYGYHVDWAARRVQPGQCVFVVPHGALREMCFAYRRYRKMAWLRKMQSFFRERSTFIFSSGYERDEALDRISPRHSEILSWPVSPELLSDGPPLPETPVLLLAGRLHPSKRTLETVRAFRRLARPGWQLHLAGLPSTEISVADVCAEAGPAWERSVFYRGSLNFGELARAYAEASGVVLLSHGENFANAIAEGVANGCAAFITDRVGLASEVLSHEWGMVFESHRITDTAAELEAAMDFCERDTGQARSRRLLQSRDVFSLERFSRRLHEITAQGVERAAA